MQSKIETPTESNHVCPHQFAFMLDNGIRRWFQNPQKIVGDYIKAGDRVMDVGCGPGFFAVDMAELVGAEGKVIAVDIQERMLSNVKKKAEKRGVVDRMVFHRCRPDGIGVSERLDFVLAYWMVHETPDPQAFLSEAKGLINPGGKLLVVEPKFHVKKRDFDAMLKTAESVGLTALDFPKGKGGWSVLLSVNHIG